MRKTASILALAAALATGACSNMDRTQQNVLSGAAIGAGVGLAAGALTHGLGMGTGALIGAGAGAVGGLIVDQAQTKKK